MPDGTYVDAGPGQQQKPDTVEIQPDMFDSIVGPGQADTTANAPALSQQDSTIRPGMFDDIVGPSSSSSASTEQPSFFQRVGAALKNYLPQPGEGVLHTAGRDVTGVAKGIVKPFQTTLTSGWRPSEYLNPDGSTNWNTVETQGLASAQALTTLAAGPVEGALAERLGGGLAGRVLSGAAVGAGAGAIYNPQDPGVGAFIGGSIGAPLGSIRSVDIATKALPETPFAEPAKDAADLAITQATADIAKSDANEAGNESALAGNEPSQLTSGNAGGANDVVHSGASQLEDAGGNSPSLGRDEAATQGEQPELLALDRGAADGGEGETPPPPHSENVGGDDEGSRPGPSGYGFTQDEEADLLGQYLNLNKFQVSGDAQKAVLRLALQKAITDNGITGKLRIGWEQTLAGAKHVLDSMSPQEVAALGAKQVRESGAMTRDVSAAHTLLYRRLTQQVEGLGTAIRDKNIPINQAHELTDKLNQVVDDQTQIAANMVRSHSEYGRQLNSLKIAASQTTDPTYWLLRASKMRDGAPLSADEQMEITGALNKINTATDAFQRTKAQNLLAAKVAGMKYLSAWQKSASVYRANLLSSPSSLIGAALGHASFAALDATDKNLAGFYDMLIGSVTGQRTTPFAPLADMRARFRGMVQAARDVPSLIRTGEGTVQGVVDQADKDWGLDQIGDKQLANGLERITDPLLRGGNITFGVWSKMVLRMYGVVPHIIKGGAMEASLESQARLAAMGENLGGKLLEQRVQQLRAQWRQDGLPEQVQRQMIEDGNVAALTNQGYLAYGTSMVKRGAESAFGAPGRFVADAALPFTTVPSNLIEQGLKHSPFAGVYGAGKLSRLFASAMKGQAKAAAQQAAVDNLARASTGAGAMLAGYLLAKAGLATGPADDNDRRQIAIMTGRQPDAIRLGSEWYNDSRFAPISSLVELGVYYHDMLNDPRQITGTTDPNASQAKGFMEGTVNAYAQTIKDAPFAQGVKYISDAITEPGNAVSNYVRDVSRGIVPTVSAHAETAMDPYVRQPDTQHGFLRGIGQTIESRIPIPAVYNQVPVKPNPLGLPTTHESGVVAGFTPYPATADQTLTDPVMKAISESGVSLPSIKLAPGESEEAYQSRVQEIARATYAHLNQLVSSPGWQNIDQYAVTIAARPDVPYTPAEVAQYYRQQLIKQVVSQAKSRAARETSPRANAPAMLRALIHPATDDDNSSTPNE